MSKGNEPAFPSFKKEGEWTSLQPVGGLTKRELFAAMAMHGLLSYPWPDLSPVNEETKLPQRALYYADALIAELDKKAEE